MSLPAYPKYKESRVAWLPAVPAAWQVAPLRRFRCTVQTGPFGSQLHADEYISGGVPVINPINMVNGRIVPSDDVTVSTDVVSRLSHQVLRPKDIVFARRGELGRCALVTDNEAGWLCGTGSMILRLHDVDFDAGYLARYLSLDIVRQHFESASIGSTMDSLSSQTLQSLPVLAPPFDQQAAIDAFLTIEVAKIDALISEQRRLIKLLDEKLQAVIFQTVARGLDPHAPTKNPGIAGLREIPVHWQVRRLKNISPFITVGIVVNPSSYVSDEGYPFIYGGDIREGIIDWANARRIDAISSAANSKTRLRAGDLVTVRVGAPGVTAVVPKECENGNCASVMLIRQGEFDSHWLCYVMNTRIVRYQVEVVQYGAAQEQFNIAHAINFRVPVPPRREQDDIVKSLARQASETESLMADIQHAIDLLLERRAALISAAMTGQIDVRNVNERRSAA
jgi:type I restriction enzyme S subunit